MNRQKLLLKIGGHDLSEPEYLKSLAGAVALLQQSHACVLVHGGGRAIDELLSRLQVAPVYVNGQRVTDNAALEAAEMVLSGKINKSLVWAMQEAGLDCLGLSGIDRGLLKVEPWSDQMGRVGRVTAVKLDVLLDLILHNIVPVISPISAGPDGKYNVNADHAAGMIAGALRVEQAVFVSNVPGIQLSGEIAPRLSQAETNHLIETGEIFGGMIPKVAAALQALDHGAKSVLITDLSGLAEGQGTTIIQQRSSDD